MSIEKYWHCQSCGALNHPSYVNCPRCTYAISSLGTSAEPKQNPGHESVAEAPGENPNPTKCLVRYTLFRKRLLDDENGAGTKAFTDALCLAGILFDDSQGYAKIEVEQVKVMSECEERTEITIEPYERHLPQPT